jgi:methionyl-tRNA formyltransferase
MDSKVDHGPILGHKEISINPNDTTETLKEKMGQLAAPFLVEILDQYFRGELTPIPQNEVRATFTKKITTQDSTLSVQAEPLKLYNFYRAYKDEPGLFVQLNNNQILKIIKAKYEDGQFVPLIIQKPGKKPISYQNFLLGWRETPPFSLS